MVKTEDRVEKGKRVRVCWDNLIAPPMRRKKRFNEAGEEILESIIPEED